MKSSSAKMLIVAFALLAILPGCGIKTSPGTAPPEKNVQQPQNSQSAKASPAVDPARAAESEKHFQQGLKLYEEYEYSDAIAEYDKAITDNPANFRVYTAKGIALCFQGDYKGGMALIQKTLDMNPGYVPAFYDMAMAYKLQNNYDQSLYWFEKTIQGDPQNTWSYYGIATIHADRGNKQESLKYLKKAIEFDPGVKAVTRRQAHFDQMRNMPEFQDLVR